MGRDVGTEPRVRRYRVVGGAAAWCLPLATTGLVVAALALGSPEIAAVAGALGWVGHGVSRGLVVESAPATEIFERQFHPYSAALLRAAPSLESGKKVFQPIAGEIPSALNPPGGCHFHPRCPHAMERCRNEPPALAEVEGRMVACHLYG